MVQWPLCYRGPEVGQPAALGRIPIILTETGLLCAIEDSLEKLNIESVVEMAGPGLKRRQKGSEKKLPLTQVKCARSLGPEVQQPPLCLLL